ncbi:MAG TPA: DUF424 domain-containing protein [Candidatus Altiarchaeales archaeon]|nr:DUF424 domain-containing protein [Candidatus Altiarchaeales archaeon]
MDSDKIYIKIYKVDNEVLVAACDEEILGMEFSEGDLKLKVSENFYKGKLINLDELEMFLREATIANLTGNKVVEKAIELGFVNKESVLTISGIKHAQIVEVFY